MARTALVLGSILLLLAVTIGAFGAHALSSVLEINQRIDTFETASRYHFYHAIALVLVGILVLHYKNLVFQKAIVISFFLGILFFSGSLYCLAVFNMGWLGAIAPIGGGLFILGWFLFAIAVCSMHSTDQNI